MGSRCRVPRPQRKEHHNELGLAVGQTFADPCEGFRSGAQFALLDLPVGERQRLLCSSYWPTS